MALTETMYIRYNTQQEAKLASANYWDRLGHSSDAGNVTQFIFDAIHCPNNNSGYLVLKEPLFSQLWPLLTAQEQNFVNANMVPASNSQVAACLASIPPPVPPLP